jgi:hypothetical protein
VDAVTLDSAWYKWDWAVRHSQLLQADIVSTLKPDGDPDSDSVLRIGQEYDPQLQAWVVKVTFVGIIPPRLSLLAGDAIQNFRSALDHLAWFLAQRSPRASPLTKDQERGIYFPFCNTEEHFAHSIPRKLPGVPETDLAIIRQYQPYITGDELIDRHAFRVLADLSDHDKHRTLQPVGIRLSSVECKAINSHDCVIRRIITSKSTELIHVNTKLATIFTRKTGPNPTFQVEIQPAADVAFNENIWVKNLLDNVQENVFKLLLAFGAPPDELVISEPAGGQKTPLEAS